MKIGAKSKKDPHIRVGGRTEESVMRAKMMITEVLDTTTNSRVTMKMDVSYTDHSHIIGKGGNTIRRVMAETNCHIHFPDSNRSNPNEKSNQVLPMKFPSFTFKDIHHEFSPRCPSPERWAVSREPGPESES